MPCRSDYDEPVYHPIQMPRFSPQEKLENKVKALTSSIHQMSAQCKELKDELHKVHGMADQLTQFLCYACGLIRTVPTLIDEVDPRLKDWLKDHDEWDEKRTYRAFQEEFPGGGVSKQYVYEWFVNEALKVHPLSEWHKTVFFDKIWEKYSHWIEMKENAAALRKEKLAQIAKLQAELKELESI